MNKGIGIVMLSLVCASVTADENSSRIEQISTAVEESDLARVKALWRRLDSSIDSLDEKEKILRSLFKAASQVAEDSEDGQVVGGDGKGYVRIIGGAILCALGCTSVVISGVAFRNLRVMIATPFLIGGLATSYAGHYLFTGGWQGSSDQIAAGGRSKAKIVKSYLESRLQEVIDEVESHKKSTAGKA